MLWTSCSIGQIQQVVYKSQSSNGKVFFTSNRQDIFLSYYSMKPLQMSSIRVIFYWSLPKILCSDRPVVVYQFHWTLKQFSEVYMHVPPKKKKNISEAEKNENHQKYKKEERTWTFQPKWPSELTLLKDEVEKGVTCITCVDFEKEQKRLFVKG